MYKIDRILIDVPLQNILKTARVSEMFETSKEHICYSCFEKPCSENFF